MKMKPYRHRPPALAHRIGVALALGALVVGGLPAALSYRCLAMDTVASKPCCDEALAEEGDGHAALLASCCERIEAAAAPVSAVREPGPVDGLRPVATLSLAFTDSALARAPTLGPAVAWLRPGPLHPSTRTATIVLRV